MKRISKVLAMLLAVVICVTTVAAELTTVVEAGSAVPTITSAVGGDNCATIGWTAVTSAMSYRVCLAKVHLTKFASDEYVTKATTSTNSCLLIDLDAGFYKVKIQALVGGSWTSLDDCDCVSMIVKGDAENGSVLINEGFQEFHCGNWSTVTLSDITMEEFITALSTPGAQLVITRSEAVKVDAYPTGYELFHITDNWYSMAVAEGDSTSHHIKLGTAAQTNAMTTANDNLYGVHIDALIDDGVTVIYDGNAIAELINASLNVNAYGIPVIISNTSTKNYDITSVSVVTGDIISDALLSVNYTVSYNANGGSGAPESQTKAYGNALTLSATVPTREGYNFLGWSISPTATTATYAAGATYTANSDVTLYAVWEIKGATECVTGFKGTRGDRTIKLSWNPVKGAASYTVYWKKSSGSTWNKASTTDKTSVSLEGLTNGVSYDFKIVANGQESGILTISPSATSTDTVTAFTIADFTDDGKVTLDDAIYLLYHTFNPNGYPLNQPADFTGDGNVTLDDAIYLLYYTFNPIGYPLA